MIREEAKHGHLDRVGRPARAQQVPHLADGPLPRALAGPGLRTAVADILRWVWTTTLVHDWPRRRRVLEADIVARTSRLASHGWADVFATLGSRTCWVGDGHLQINGYDLPSRDLSAAQELSFVPVHSDVPGQASQVTRI
jgi:hypothetical protein